MTAVADGVDHDGEILQRIRRGTRVWLARGVATRCVSLLTNLALVVLVTPRQLGLLAAVRGAIYLLTFASELGLEAALVRRRADPTAREMAALTGARMLALAAITLGFVVVPGARTLFGTIDPALGGWTIALVATSAITPLQLGPKVRLERALQFGRLGALEVSTVLLENVGLVLAAWVGRFDAGVFVVFMLSFAFVTAVTQRMAPGGGVSLDAAPLRALLADTAAFSGASLFQVARTALTPILLARVFGLPTAGVWALADRVCSYLNLVFDSYARAAFAGAARLARSGPRLGELATHALEGTIAWAAPASVLLFAAFPMLGVVFPKWQGAVAPGQVYVLALGVAGSIAAALGPVVQAWRGPRYALLEQGTACLVLWLGLGVVARAGAGNVGVAFAAGALAQALVLVAVCGATLRPRVAAALARPLLGAAIVVASYVAAAAAHVAPLARGGLAGVLLLAWQAASLRPRTPSTA